MRCRSYGPGDEPTAGRPTGRDRADLFQADDQIPADVLRQLEDRGLGVESIQLEDVEATASVEVGDFAQQAQGGRVLALVGLQPLQGQKGLDRATDDLAADRPVVVRHLFDFHPSLPGRDATFAAGVAATAVAGKHLDPLEGGDDAALHPAFLQSFAPLPSAIDLYPELL